MKADFEKGTKVCSCCKKELPVSEFYKNKKSSDELNYWCKQCVKKYAKKHIERRKEIDKRSCDKNFNTFGRFGHKKGRGKFTKRDYELTEEQLQRRNKMREKNGTKTSHENPHGILIWYDGTLNNLTSKEYNSQVAKEYNRQRSCAIRGYIGRAKPSEHFLFDFDLEQMLKDKAYVASGNRNIYITKWWEGTIKHWTVNDGIWKKENKSNE